MIEFFTAWWSYGFMRNAFIAILIITPLFGILGTMIVNNKMAFFSDALGHSALTGIALGVVMGVADTIISVFSSACIAVGLAILSKGGNFSKYSSLLVGDVLSISKKEIIYLILIFAATLIFWGLAFNKLNAVSLHRALAKSRGIRVKLIENIFAIFIALIVMLSIKWIGILIINALLILPAAASRNISVNMREYHLFSVIFSLFSGLLGLMISYFTNVATGPMIVIVAAIIYFATYVYGRRNA